MRSAQQVAAFGGCTAPAALLARQMGGGRRTHKGYAQEAEAAGGDEVEGGDRVQLDAAALQIEGERQWWRGQLSRHANQAGRLNGRKGWLRAAAAIPVRCTARTACAAPCSASPEKDLHQGEARGLCCHAGHLQDHSNHNEIDLCSQAAGRRAGTRREGGRRNGFKGGRTHACVLASPALRGHGLQCADKQ